MISKITYLPVSFKATPQNNPLLDREKTVAILGSSKENEQNKDYIEMARQVGYDLAKQGYNVVTGGCTGINEAANKGANAVDPDKSFGVAVKGWDDLRDKNIFKLLTESDSGPDRTNLFRKIAKYWVIFPGGPGSLEELSIAGESKYYKANPFPEKLILVGKAFYNPFMQFLQNMNQMKVASNAEKLYDLADSKEEIINNITGSKLNMVA